MYLFQLCVYVHLWPCFLKCLWISYSACISCFWLSSIQANLRVQLLVHSIKCLLHSMYHSAIKVLLKQISNNWKSRREKNISTCFLCCGTFSYAPLTEPLYWPNRKSLCIGNLWVLQIIGSHYTTCESPPAVHFLKVDIWGRTLWQQPFAVRVSHSRCPQWVFNGSYVALEQLRSGASHRCDFHAVSKPTVYHIYFYFQYNNKTKKVWLNECDFITQAS